MKRAAVLGTGLVGGLIAQDLAADPDFHVVAVDRDEGRLDALAGIERLETIAADLSDAGAIAEVASAADIVVGAVPGFLAAGVQRAVIECGKPLADISFGPGDPLELDAPARERGVAAVVDCGVAPGLSNLFVGRSAADLTTVEEAVICVGGLPFRRQWPYEYRIVFSPTDVIEEYTRPCRYREHGREVVRPALTDTELIDFPRVGTLEAFNTDGLRTLLHTIDAPTLKEKTLRYPGHAERMRMLRETGFLSERPVRLGGHDVVPRALTEHLLFEAWKLPDGEEEFTVLRVRVTGARDGRGIVQTWDLFDRTDAAAGNTSMARTTGFPCAVVARHLASGRWSAPGVHPPEILGRDRELTESILADLRARGIEISFREETL
ncbi:MAG: saccharopine dehydrogenase C-terminal domain-containing protein [Acidobacteriota bacterium]|nr:saccharopine dehydrogenase C-terminal domain-containing protein [Acidobacteriota bacterium]